LTSKGFRREILAGLEDFYGFTGFDSKIDSLFDKNEPEFSKRMNIKETTKIYSKYQYSRQ
jgi:hypothetical protein